MPERQLKVMISGTFRDLVEYRKQAVEACLRLGMEPLTMEAPSAGPDDGSEFSLSAVDRADIYLLILGHRYGYVPRVNNPAQVSIVELEYNRALELGIPCLAFIMDEDYPVKPNDIETGEGAVKLERFKSRLRARHIVRAFRSPEDLRANVIDGLSRSRQRIESPKSLGVNLGGPVITKIEPYSIVAGGMKPIPVRLAGDGFEQVSTLRLNSVDRKPDIVSANEIVFELTPEDIHDPGPIEIVAVWADGSVSTAVTLQVRSDPEVPTVSFEGDPLIPRVRGFMLADSAVPSSAASDQPILETTKDKLGFSVYAKALRDFIASKDTATPLTISVEAPWGQGKSSLMRMIKYELNPGRSWYLRFWIWLKLQGWRLRWLIASPVWWLSKVGIWIAHRYKWRSESLKELEEGMLDTSHYGPPSSLGDRVGSGAGESKFRRIARWCARVRLPVEAHHPTVWFNAWKYDQEEAIWSALASTILEQIKSSHSWIGRFSIWFRLSLKRTNRLLVLKDLFRKLFWPALLAALVWLWHNYSGYVSSLINRPFTEAQFSVVKRILQAALVLTSGIKLASIIEDPFSLPFDKYVKAPDYRKKIGFIADFEEDFKRIVKLVTSPVWGWKPRKLVIFIDDLDRCEPPKSADVVEAINVFLDSPGCVFVIGMDSRAVVASIELKYEKMFQKLQQESPDSPSLGRNFLEKIIQVPFAIPSMADRFMTPFVIDVIGPKPIEPSEENGATLREGVDMKLPLRTEPVGAIPQPATASPAGEERKEDVGSYSNMEVWQAINNGVQYLETNPRQLKRFINLFRLQVYISNSRKLFSESSSEASPHAGYTLNSLAAWTVFSMRWPLIVASLAQEYQQAALRNWLLQIAQIVDARGFWIETAYKESRTMEDALSRFLSVHLTDNSPATHGPKRKATSGAARSGSVASKNEAKETGIRFAPYWKQLPWDIYLGNRDFLQIVKALESWWHIPVDEQARQEQRDWLSMAMMFQQ